MGTLTNIGLEYTAQNLNGVATKNFRYIALGTGSTAESVNDTALGAENSLYGSARKIATCTYSAPNTARWNALFSFTGSVVVREYGLFDSISGGNLLYRRVLPANRSYTDGDGAEFTVTCAVAGSP